MPNTEDDAVKQLNNVMKALENATRIEAELIQVLSRTDASLAPDVRANAAAELSSTIHCREALLARRQKALATLAAETQ